MPTASNKLEDFFNGAMGDKPVTELAGIDQLLGKRLEEKGYDKAYAVLGQFLLFKKDKECFLSWLNEFNANSKQSNDCYECLCRWCKSFL